MKTAFELDLDVFRKAKKSHASGDPHPIPDWCWPIEEDGEDHAFVQFDFYCPQCGRHVHVDRFCHRCGYCIFTPILSDHADRGFAVKAIKQKAEDEKAWNRDNDQWFNLNELSKVDWL